MFPNVGAAPHCPAGHFSPYSDGEKEAGRNAGRILPTLMIGEIIGHSTPLYLHERDFVGLKRLSQGPGGRPDLGLAKSPVPPEVTAAGELG
ncbi:hypothetical protein EN794_049230, partial [Mesorhizobium sp. M00.F.Ca.ET.151.01.1.1]